MKAITQRMLDQQMIGRAIVNRKRTISASILQEQRAIDKEFNNSVTPSSLYSYYISICQNPTWDLTNDKKVAKQLGCSERSVANHRRSLARSGWIRFEKFTHRNIEYGLWYIGKEVVSAKIGIHTTIDKLHDLGIINDDEYLLQSPNYN